MPLDPNLIDDILHCRLPDKTIVDYLASLSLQTLTAKDLHQWVTAIQKIAVTLPSIDIPVLDCCGTGGSGSPHYNTSTTVAFVLAAGGVPVVKFGNRAIQSNSGSFDLLAQLGMGKPLNVEYLPAALEKCNLAFLYAPQCYPALTPFNRLRRTLKVPTLFNFIGPLLNPINPTYRLMGISSGYMQTVIGEYLVNYNPPKRGWLVHSPTETDTDQGIDEIVPNALTHCLEIHKNQVKKRTIPPTMGGTSLQAMPISHSPKENVAIFNELITGNDQGSYYHRLVCLNAGAAFLVSDHIDSLDQGAELASELLAKGKVFETVNRCRRLYETHQV